MRQGGEAHLILILLCDMVTGMKIVGTSGNSSLVKLGSTMTMTCQADRRWFLCLWTSPRGDRQCAIQEGQGTTTTVCQGDSRVELEGDSTTCTIRVRGAQQEDQGDWMCLLQDGQQFHTDRMTLGLEVAQPGVLVMLVDGRRMEEGESVILTEGETVGVVCRLEDAFPRPIFSWMGPGVGNLTVEDAGRHMLDEQEHLYLSHSTSFYTASINDTNATVSCQTEQHDRTGVLLYSHTMAAMVEVEALPIPLPYSLSAKVGVLSGVILTVVFLLLVCVVVTTVMCRRQREEQRSPDSSIDFQRDSLQPVWTSSRWPSLPSSKKREVSLMSAAPSYSVVNLSSEAGGGLNSTPTSRLSSSASILSDNSPPHGFSLKPAPSLHETHFSDLNDQPPVTLLHPPGLFLQLPHRSVSLLPDLPRRVSSSQSEGFPCCAPSSQGSRYWSFLKHMTLPSTFRPVSSMGVNVFPNGHRDMQKLSVQTLPGYRIASSSSLFDCPHDCFAERAEHTHLEEEAEMDNLNQFARVVQEELEQALHSLDHM